MMPSGIAHGRRAAEPVRVTSTGISGSVAGISGSAGASFTGATNRYPLPVTVCMYRGNLHELGQKLKSLLQEYEG